MNHQEELNVINASIAKIKAIPFYKFCVNLLQDELGRHCFMGHYGVSHPYVGDQLTQELSDIGNIANKYLNPGNYTLTTMVAINNDEDPRYKQLLVKDRLLAALYDIKKMILTQNPPVDDVINQITSHQEPITVLQEELSMTV